MLTMATAKDEVDQKYGAFHKRFTLTRDQKTILERPDGEAQYVHVTGPLGTGKTTVLMCKGLEWLQQGKDVVVCSVHRASVPTSCYLHTLLQEAKKAHDSAGSSQGEAEWGQVRYWHYLIADEEEVTKCLHDVASLKSADRHLNLLFDFMQAEHVTLVALLHSFIRQLKTCLPQTAIWASDWCSTVPEGFLEQHLQQPLRYTQQIFTFVKFPVDVMEQAGQLSKEYAYHTTDWHAPNGPEVIHLRHQGKQREEKWPINSYNCGQKMAKVLRHLNVGSVGTKEGGSKGGNKAEHYQYRDVLIITRSQIKPGLWPAFARGLEAAGIPTKVFHHGDDITLEEALSDLILAPEDKVIVTNHQAITGLDRKVVVCLTGVGTDETWEVTDEEDQQMRANPRLTVQGETLQLTLEMNDSQLKAFRNRLLQLRRAEAEMMHRLTLWSRCTTQLIVVHLPESMQGPRDFKIHSLEDHRCTIV